MDQKQFTYLGRLTTIIAVSLVEAIALAGEGNTGQEYRDRVSHTRALYDELLEELITVGPNGGEFARGLADSIGVRLEELERRTERADTPLHAENAKRVSAPTNDRAELWHLWPVST